MTPAPVRTRDLDLLRLPGVRAVVRWRHARLLLQLPLLALALLALYDGFTGSPLAGRNVATVSVWVQYRGLLALALVVFGNLFCAACPLMLTRGPSRWLNSRWQQWGWPDLRWPRPLRNKYLTLGLTVAFLCSYEAFALWSSPWLTAWLILGYFLAALLTDGLFPAGTFCRFVCPLGNFNFVLSGVSPTALQPRDPRVCRSCTGKECVNGRAPSGPPEFGDLQMLPMQPPSLASTPSLPGCESRLYVPALRGMQDCTLCLNCVRACPHDNVALVVRSPLQQALTERPKTDLALMQTLLAWAGILNALAMTPSGLLLGQWLAGLLHTRDAPLVLTLLMLVGLALGTGFSLLTARLGRTTLRHAAPLMLPLTVAMWGGHSLYHFLLGASTLWPAVVQALIRLGLPLALPGLPTVPRADEAFWLQLALCEVALAATVWATVQRSRAGAGQGGGPRMRAAPLLLQALVYTGLCVWIFAQPMQARAGLF